MAREDSSDPLPYAQVDRAVKPKATLLAAALGVTPQHALGSLIDFWELNGDPREIERLLLAGQEEVVLSAEEITGRFTLASGGKAADPSLLVNLGLLEPQGANLFRVRGMSRYFQPIRRRLQARDAAKRGGKASAEARKAAFGSSDPRSQVASPDASHPLEQLGSEREAEREANVKRDVKRTGSDAEAAVKQRSAVSGHPSSKSSSGEGDLFGAPTPADDAPARMIEIWNSNISGRIPKARATAENTKRLRAWLESYPLTEWKAFVCRVGTAPLLRGDRGNWRATLDWVLKPENIAKILAGNYDDDTPLAPVRRDGPACSVPDCGAPSVADLGEHRVCREHDQRADIWWKTAAPNPEDRTWESADWPPFLAWLEGRLAS